MSRFLFIVKILFLLSLGPIVAIGSLKGELKGAIWGCPYPLPFIMCNSCPVFCTFGAIRFGLFYGLLGGNLIMGRAFCGFICPGGAAQDLLLKIPTKKLSVNRILDKGLRYLKYFLALVIVLIILEASGIWRGIPVVSDFWAWLVQHESSVSIMLIALIAAALVLAITVSRPFCRYLCPLGTWISPFNRYSLIELKYDDSKCIQCHQCSESCSAGIAPTNVGWDSAECNRCLNCYTGCETNAFSLRLKGRRQEG